MRASSPATPAPPSIPAPFPALAASSLSSVRANVSSCLTSVGEVAAQVTDDLAQAAVVTDSDAPVTARPVSAARGGGCR